MFRRVVQASSLQLSVPCAGELQTGTGELLAYSTKPLSLPYQPPLVRLCRVVMRLPLLIVGLSQEETPLRVTLFDNMKESVTKPFAMIRVELAPKFGQRALPNIRSARVQVKLKFLGLSFLLAYFPFATFAILELVLVGFIILVGVAVLLAPYVVRFSEYLAKELQKAAAIARARSKSEFRDAETSSLEGGEDLLSEEGSEWMDQQSSQLDSESAGFSISESEREGERGGMSPLSQPSVHGAALGLRQRRVGWS